MSNVPKTVLENRLAEIDKRRAIIDAELKHLDKRSYRFQELAHEYRNLEGLRVANERQLNPPDPAIQDAFRLQLQAQAERMRQRHAPKSVTPEEKAARASRRARIIDALEAQERANMERAAQRFEQEGDHRNARLWREFAWQIRKRLEAQIS